MQKKCQIFEFFTLLHANELRKVTQQNVRTILSGIDLLT